MTKPNAEGADVRATQPQSLCQRVAESPRRSFHLGSPLKPRRLLRQDGSGNLLQLALDVSEKRGTVSPFQQFTFSSIIQGFLKLR
jgi:hypothetical protein